MRGRGRTRLKQLRISGWKISEVQRSGNPEICYLFSLEKDSVGRIILEGASRPKAIFQAHKEMIRKKFSYAKKINIIGSKA